MKRKNQKGNIRAVLIILSLVAITVGIVLARPKPPAPSSGEVSKPIERPVTQPKTEEIRRLLKLTNKERATLNVNELVLDERLVKSAEIKCLDMQARNYWEHETTPGELKEHFDRHLPPNALFSAENLARNYDSPEETVKGWMDSPSHRENIVNPAYNVIGFATCSGPVGDLTIQHFSYITM